MPASVSAAIQRFRRRLLLAAFVRGAATSGFALLLAATFAVLLARVAAPSMVTPSAGWTALVVATASLALGAVTALRLRPGDAFVVQHLERRLGTGGLLLAAADGAALEDAWQRRLQQALAALPRALPVVRWRRLTTRPALAALLLLATEALPQPAPAPVPEAAVVVAAADLLAEAEQVAALPNVPDEPARELLEAARALQQRAAGGETDLWRELDGLEQRLARERQLAEVGASSDGAASAESPRDGRGAAPDAQQLAEALQRLRGARATEELLADVPRPLREQVAAAARPDGGFDADALPQDEASRAALGEALAEAARDLAGDAEAVADLAESLQGASAEELARQLEQLADELAPAPGDPSPLPAFAQELAAELADDLARAALEMAKSGALDELPGELPEGMRELLAAAAEQLAGSMDVEALRALLPDDLPQMRALAEAMADAARELGGSPAGGDLAGGEGQSAGEGQSSGEGQPGGGADGLSAASRRELAALADELQRSAAGQDPSGGRAGASGDGGERGGVDGGGHTALRMTERAAGGVGQRELELPQREPAGELPDEWKPLRADKAEPEVADVRAAGPGGEGAAGTGAPTWQLRLRPRHRALLRRFYAEDKR